MYFPIRINRNNSRKTRSGKARIAFCKNKNWITVLPYCMVPPSNRKHKNEKRKVTAAFFIVVKVFDLLTLKAKYLSLISEITRIP